MKYSVFFTTLFSFLSMFFLGVGMSVIGAAAQNIGLETYQIGLLQTLQYVGFAAAVTLFGVLSDRYSRTGLLAVGTLITAGAFFFLYRYPPFLLNVAVMFLVGSGMGAFEGVTDALLMDIHPRRPGGVIAINHLFVTIGAMAITIYLIFLQINWRASLVQAAIVLIVITVGFLALPSFCRRGDASLTGSARNARRFSVLLRERTLLLLTLASTAGIGVQIAMTGTLTTYLVTDRAFSDVTSKVALLLFVGGLAVGRVLFGMFIKPHRYSRVLLLLFGLSAALNALVFLLDSGVLTYPVVFAAGFVISCMLPLVITFAGLAYREQAGSAMGVVKLGIPAGGILVPLLVSILARALSPAAAYAALAVIPALVFAILRLGRAHLADVSSGLSPAQADGPIASDSR